MVGEVTFPRRISGLPAIRLSLAEVVSISGPAAAWACGHSGNVMWPGAGSHAGFWANRLDEMARITQRRNECLDMVSLLESRIRTNKDCRSLPLPQVVDHAAHKRSAIRSRNSRKKCEKRSIDLRSRWLDCQHDIGGQFCQR